MSIRYVRYRLLGLALLALLHSGARTAVAQDIWFHPHTPQPHMSGPDDWYQLFDKDSKWPTVRARTKMFGFAVGYIDYIPDDTLRAIVDNLHDHNIGVLVTIQALARENNECGAGQEGYYNPRQVLADAKKLARVGARLEVVMLDGPLDFGHYYDSPTACHFTIDEVAHRVAQNLAGLIEAFPDVKIGDVEGSPIADRPNAEADYRAWKKAFEAATGKPLSFLHLDVKWSSPDWRRQVRTLATMSRHLGMQFGVIYNGDGADQSDREWADHASRNFQEIESALGVIPDQAVFAGWDLYPKHILPETADTTIAGIARRYLLPRTRIDVTAAAHAVTGALQDAAGRPIPHATIAVESGGIGPGVALPRHVLVGTVPAGARQALLGLRINLECNCPSIANDFRTGDLIYEETAGGSERQVRRYASQIRGNRDHDAPDVKVALEDVAGAPVVHVVTDDRHGVMFNSRPFAVTPGARYKVTAELGTATAQALNGYATIIWFDANMGGKLGRNVVMDHGDFGPAGSVETDASGRFTMRRQLAVDGKPAPLKLFYPGTQSQRPAMADVP